MEEHEEVMKILCNVVYVPKESLSLLLKQQIYHKLLLKFMVWQWWWTAEILVIILRDQDVGDRDITGRYRQWQIWGGCPWVHMLVGGMAGGVPKPHYPEGQKK